MDYRRHYHFSRLLWIAVVAPLAAPAHAAPEAPAPEVRTIAVLPFTQNSPRKEDEYLQGGFAEHLTTALARLRAVRVVERSHLKRILDEQKLGQSGLVDESKAAQIGKLAGARQVIVGSFIRIGNQMQINCRFVDTETSLADPDHVARVDGKLAAEEEIFALLDRLSEAVLKTFGVQPTVEEKKQLAVVAQATRNPGAHEQYLLGREKYLQMSLAGWKEAASLFQKAVDTDAKYALAWAGKAESLRLWGFQEEQRGQDAAPRYSRALEAAKKAVELAPDLPEAHRALASVLLHRGEPGQSKEERKRQCEAAARKAVSLNDRDAEACVWLWEALGRPVEGEGSEYIRKALEINPDLLVAHNDLGNRYAGLNRLEDALRHCKKAVDLSPRNMIALGNLAGCYLLQGDMNRANETLQKAMAVEPDVPPLLFVKGLILEKRSEKALAEEDFAQAQARAVEALGIYADLTRRYPRYPDTWARLGALQLGLAQMGMGDPMTAVESLRRYVELAKDIMGQEENVAQVRRVLREAGLDVED
ncbi:MAG: tetratricopeptide repeat protein [Armatimonadetes bacterium]|nr:tetratricopeptide repeat protein [Armatimonadota bacterium]